MAPKEGAGRSFVSRSPKKNVMISPRPIEGAFGLLDFINTSALNRSPFALYLKQIYIILASNVSLLLKLYNVFECL